MFLIVPEEGTWQKCEYVLLHQHFSSLEVECPFAVKNSLQVEDYLKLPVLFVAEESASRSSAMLY